MRADTPPESEVDWSDIPPAVTCARCGSPSCVGCGPIEGVDERTETRALVNLPWESPGSLIARLGRTAFFTTEEPARAFGALSRGSAWPAFWFALWAETLAVTSIFAALAALLKVTLPWLATIVLHELTGRALIAGAAAALVVLVVALHAYFGLLVESGVEHAGGERDRVLGLRFGLYAAGWDLVTSPAGLLLAVAFRRGQALRALGAAFGVPRRATDLYLIECRHLTPEQATLARRHIVSKGTLQSLVAVVVTIVLAVLLSFSRYFLLRLGLH